MTNPVIRRAISDDGPACAEIVVNWSQSLDWMELIHTRAELETALRNGLPMREAYVIGDPVQGYLSLETEKAHIHGLYVATPGKGFGQKLLDRAKQGRDYLRLNTHLPNTAAHRFYEREGFVRTGEPWRGEDGVDEIRMEWHA